MTKPVAGTLQATMDTWDFNVEWSRLSRKSHTLTAVEYGALTLDEFEAHVDDLVSYLKCSRARARAALLKSVDLDREMRLRDDPAWSDGGDYPRRGWRVVK